MGALLAACCGMAQDSKSLKSSADQRLEAGENGAALQLYQQAVAALPDGAESQAAADLALEVAKKYYIKQDAARCKLFARRAVELQQRITGPGTVPLARAMVELGLALHISGEYAEATPQLEKALEILQKNLGAEKEESIRTLNRLALNLLRAGDTARARILEEQSLALCEKNFGPYHPLATENHRNMAQILQALGDFAGSQKQNLRALEILEHQKGGEALEVADTLVTMGGTAREAGRPAEAKQRFERAASIYEKIFGPHNTRVGGTLDNTGEVMGELKQYAEARKVLERALAIQTQELGARHPWTGNVIQGLARVEAGAGNYEKARELYEQNLSIWREKLGPEHPFTVVSMAGLADVLAHLGRYREAIDVALESAAIRRENILLTVRTVDERLALQYSSLHTASMDTALSIAVQPGATAAEQTSAWDALIRSRALVLDEMIARYRSIQASADSEVAALARKVADARSQITKAVLQGPGASSAAEYKMKLELVRGQLNRAEDQLALASTGFRHERDQHRVGFDEVRTALPSGSTLVAFRRYEKKSYRAADDSSIPSYVAFVLTGQTAQPVAVPLGPASRIDALVRKWRAEIDRERKSIGRAASANQLSYRTAAAALRLAVWDPIQRRTGRSQRIFIVPDGSLQGVNFAALPTPDGKYLLENGPLIHILPAERDLADSRPSLASGQLLAVANPAFQQGASAGRATHRGSTSACGDFASVRFGDLPGSLAEARTILQIWRASGGQAAELMGADATEGAVKRSVAGKRVVHFATHGFFLDGECPQDTGATRESPLFRSGLALAGANQRHKAAAKQEDGILTAEEVASLDLGKAEWVVLSGCDTGVGDLKNGEGVLGLRRAFQEAGARTLVASLWPVEDEESRQWMAALYRARFAGRMGTAEALRAADLEQLQARRTAGKSVHPFYWAGFVAVGDWR
jgi:CHAT domain-containing protein/Tfp pilus assembly protein PilF